MLLSRVRSGFTSVDLRRRATLILLLTVLAAPVSAQQFYFSAGGGPLTLTIDNAVAGSEPDQALDSSTEIYWDAYFQSESKITVSTICPGQSFSLYVEFDVTSWGLGTEGTTQAEIPLTDGMMDADLFRDIPTTAPERQGFATLNYRAKATVSQGNSSEHGDDYHTVTYTILAQ